MAQLAQTHVDENGDVFEVQWTRKECFSVWELNGTKKFGFYAQHRYKGTRVQLGTDDEKACATLQAMNKAVRDRLMK